MEQDSGTVDEIHPNSVPELGLKQLSCCLDANWPAAVMLPLQHSLGIIEDLERHSRGRLYILTPHCGGMDVSHSIRGRSLRILT